GQNFVRPTGRPRTTATGYLLSRRTWNKVSGHDIITNAEGFASALVIISCPLTLFHVLLDSK
ncbi:hypothetical protein, partial [Streptococcus pyogenes]|uniref:hypothetical protein n=1 Tax=Streptococcus pyogenes TaxID=1314 RepID=UPI003D085D6E